MHCKVCGSNIPCSKSNCYHPKKRKDTDPSYTPSSDPYITVIPVMPDCTPAQVDCPSISVDCPSI